MHTITFDFNTYDVLEELCGEEEARQATHEERHHLGIHPHIITPGDASGISSSPFVAHKHRKKCDHQSARSKVIDDS